VADTNCFNAYYAHWAQQTPVIQEVENPFGYPLSVLRLDLFAPEIGGNKWFKLKDNLVKARAQGDQRLITFGGAFSNHIAATAQAGQHFGWATTGIIRGDEWQNKWADSPTLRSAIEAGMKLVCWPREAYRLKIKSPLWNLLPDKDSAYVVPEGGTNEQAIQACRGILGPHTQSYDLIGVAVGTGGTLSGMVQQLAPHQKMVGVLAVNDAESIQRIRTFADENRVLLTDQALFGGYGRVKPALLDWMRQWYHDTQIPLDPVYTGKMFWWFGQQMAQHVWPQTTRILLVHTGGLQGIAGINQQLKRQGITPLYDPYESFED